MPAARRTSIVFFCVALILFAALTPGVCLQPVILIPLGFVFAAPVSVPADIVSSARKPQNFQPVPIHAPRPPPVG